MERRKYMAVVFAGVALFWSACAPFSQLRHGESNPPKLDAGSSNPAEAARDGGTESSGEVSCSDLAMREMPDAATARAHAQVGCGKSDLSCCAFLGIIIATDSSSGRAEHAAARALLERSCSAILPMACAYLGDMYYYEHAGDREALKAANAYAIACGHGHANSCQSLGVLHARGALGERRDAMAAMLYERACELDPSNNGCADAGGRYVDGWGVKKDVVRGVALLKRGCLARSGYACGTLARSLRSLALEAPDGDRERTLEAALSAAERGCELESGKACELRGDMLRAKGGDANQVLADAAYRDAVRYNEFDCENGSAHSCFFLGRLFLRGHGTVPDEKKAKAFLELACKRDARLCDDPSPEPL